jgi:HAE1 family hydrophobic/amphiphilic exporter-1
MKIIELSVKRPIATGVIFAFLCGAGFFAWSRLPQEVMPDLNFPQLTIVTSYVQAAPQEIENLVTKPIEEAVGTVKNVRRVHSISKEGSSIVTVEFAWGTDMDFASLNTREKLDLVKSRLPSDVREPTIVKFNPFYTPVLILSLNAEGAVDPEFMTHIAQLTIANHLQKVEGVAAVLLSGTADKEIHLDLDQSRLAANQISLLQFNRGLATANYRGAAGTAKEGSYDYAVRVTSPFDNVDDIRNAVVAVDNSSDNRTPSALKTVSQDRERQRAARGDQRLISVSQVGTVSEGIKERTSYSRYDGKENITIMIQKQAAASTVDTVKRLQDEIADLKPLLPSDVSLSVIYNQATIIQRGVRSVLRDIMTGGMLAFLILYIFLKSWRDAVVVSIVIPACTLLTIVVMKMIGMSLNTISLGGLALGIGMLVDSSICVTENIHRRRFETKLPLIDAVIRGTTEVAGSVASFMLCSIAVFLPLLFVLGLLGQLFRDLSLTVTISHLISIAVAVTLVPSLAAVVLREKKEPSPRPSPARGEGEHLSSESQRLLSETPASSELTVPSPLAGEGQGEGRFQHFFQRADRFFTTLLNEDSFNRFREWYAERLRWSLSHPKRVWGAILAMFAASLVILWLLPTEMMPHVDAQQFLVKLTMPNGTSLEQTNEISQLVETEIRSLPETAHTTVTVGSSSDSPLTLLNKNDGRVLVDLKEHRKRTCDQIMAEARERLSHVALKGGRVELSAAGGPMSFTAGGASAVMVYLKGYDLQKLKAASTKLTQQLSGVGGLVQVRTSLALPAPEVRLQIDRERASRLGLSVADIGQTAMAAYYGRDVTSLYRDGKEIPVRVRLQESDRADLKQLRSLLLPVGGGTIPLADAATIEIGEGPSQIERLDQERFVLIQADRSAGFDRASNRAVEAILAGFSNPDVTLEQAGEKKEQRDSFISLFAVLFVSVLLVFMVMAVEFESVTQPFLILFSIPLSLIGMAVGLFLMGKTLNAVAAMGFLLLAGIVVNNGIVLIDFANAFRSETGASLRDALIEAGRTRFRPILLTALSTVVGLVPLALGIGEGAELQSPMAITVIFGLLGSTVLSLIGLPTLFLFVEERKKRNPHPDPLPQGERENSFKDSDHDKSVVQPTALFLQTAAPFPQATAPFLQTTVPHIQTTVPSPLAGEGQGEGRISP